MDDLVNNFAGHLKKMIGKKIGEEIKNKIDVNKDYIEVESEIKKNILIYLKKANEKEINDIAKNIFNSFVEQDDESIINSVKLFIRIYNYYHSMLLRKKVYQWRINIATKQKSKTKINVTKQIKEVKYNHNIHNTLYNKGMKKKEKVYTNKELKDIAKMDQCYFSNKK